MQLAAGVDTGVWVVGCRFNALLIGYIYARNREDACAALLNIAVVSLTPVISHLVRVYEWLALHCSVAWYGLPNWQLKGEPRGVIGRTSAGTSETCVFATSPMNSHLNFLSLATSHQSQ